MPWATTRVTVTGTQASIVTTEAANQEFEVTNLGPDDIVYVGPTGVTVATGFPIYPKQSRRFRSGTTGSDALFGITAAGKTAYVSTIRDTD